MPWEREGDGEKRRWLEEVLCAGSSSGARHHPLHHNSEFGLMMPPIHYELTSGREGRKWGRRDEKGEENRWALHFFLRKFIIPWKRHFVTRTGAPHVMTMAAAHIHHSSRFVVVAAARRGVASSRVASGWRGLVGDDGGNYCSARRRRSLLPFAAADHMSSSSSSSASASSASASSSSSSPTTTTTTTKTTTTSSSGAHGDPEEVRVRCLLWSGFLF